MNDDATNETTGKLPPLKLTALPTDDDTTFFSLDEASVSFKLQDPKTDALPSQKKEPNNLVKVLAQVGITIQDLQDHQIDIELTDDGIRQALTLGYLSSNSYCRPIIEQSMGVQPWS